MITELTLQNFKSFSAHDAYNFSTHRWVRPGTLRLGSLSLIIGTNASGKSNVRDGLRFIHGVSRGYTIGEIIGEKYVEGGVLQWKGIRGGVRETVTRNANPKDTTFTIRVKTRLPKEDKGGRATYSISVDVGDKSRPPVVVDESLRFSTDDHDAFKIKGPAGAAQMDVYIRNPTARKALGPALRLRSDQPAVTQLADEVTTLPGHMENIEVARKKCRTFLRTISSVRFLDLDPNSLRRPSIPGQIVLGDKGENLSSVLQAICADRNSKEALLEWTRELTPLDVADMRFPEVSLEGRIQLQIIEQGDREISAESASDGTLRFLAFAAAVLGTEPARFYFFEEIENGIHPNRAHLLINLLQTATRSGNIQVVGTTHSPALLNSLDKKSLGDASLIYRVGSVSKIRSFDEITSLSEVPVGTQVGDLLSSGWFENVAGFLEAEEEE